MRSAWAGLMLAIKIAGMLGRFWMGRNGVFSGERKTDATFWRPATRSLDPSGHALRWEMQRGAARLAWRIGVLYLLLLLFVTGAAWGIGFGGWSTRVLLSHGAILACGGAILLLLRYLRDYGYLLRIPWTDIELAVREGRKEWEEEKVLPVAGAASSILGVSWPLLREQRAAVHIPRGYQDGAKISISLPSSFAGVTPKVQENLERALAAKLGARELSSSFQLEGRHPRVLLHVPPAPPKMVTFKDVEQQLLATQEYRPLLGVTRGQECLQAEMIDDSPHIGLSGGPGSGKSTLAKLVIMQALRWGWGVVIVDWKMTKAFTWAKDLPGVTYLTDIEDIHDLGIRCEEEIDIRKRNGMGGRANVLVVRDEWNITAPLLKEYWDRQRGLMAPSERQAEPLRSPALAGYAMLDFAGREFGMFDFCIAQRFDARIFNGNTGIRECFNIKLLSRYSMQTAKMLAPGIKLPKKSNTPGRWTVIAGEEVSVIQVPWIENDEAREFALGGAPNPITPFSSSYNLSPGQQGNADTTLANFATPGVARGSQASLPVLEAESVEIHPRKLTELVDDLRAMDDRMTLKILQKAAGDAESGFPMPIGGTPNKGYTYDPESVRMWTRKRTAAKGIGS